jgi:chromosome partitioning protein
MIVSVAAQKGGVGKTSLSLHLSGVIAENNGKVLLCDVDPQASLSSTFVDDIYSLDFTLKELLVNPDIPLSDVLQKTKFENIDIVPCNLSLGQVEFELLSDPDNQYLLADKLEDVKDSYTFVLIDCPPSLGIYTRLALVASDFVLIPLECSSYAVKSTAYLLEMINRVKKRANPQLRILGYVINKLDARRRIEQDYKQIIREHFKDEVFQTEIRDNVKYVEAVSLKIPISFYKPKTEQAETYRNLLNEIENEWI